MFTLIADCGSTKVEWALLSPDKEPEPVLLFKSTGFNAAVTPVKEIRRIITEEVAPHLADFQINKLHFYGAGCIGGEVDRNLARILSELLFKSEEAVCNIEISSDLLGAARALFGNRPGIACILGTGSNSCLYDGQEIIDNTPSLGYILGDEGSGASLGRGLLSDIFKGLLPAPIIDSFQARYNLSKADLIRHVYREPSANRYLASFCPFLSDHITIPEIQSLITEEFTRFFTRNISQYNTTTHITKTPHATLPQSPYTIRPNTPHATLPIGFIGSIAYHFRNLLNTTCETITHTHPLIHQSPLPSLLRYHSLP